MALHLSNATLQEQMYVSDYGSTNCPAIFAEYGNGYLGWIGDANTEIGTPLSYSWLCVEFDLLEWEGVGKTKGSFILQIYCIITGCCRISIVRGQREQVEQCLLLSMFHLPVDLFRICYRKPGVL
jgi:hypothetical protein